jgi:hypothetical protein
MGHMLVQNTLTEGSHWNGSGCQGADKVSMMWHGVSVGNLLGMCGITGPLFTGKQTFTRCEFQ